MRPRVTSVGLLMSSGPAEEFAYPSHIDSSSLAALPAKPGVYFFLDRQGIPLYIGKSINLRSRVLAHLRTQEESAMLAQTRRIDFIRTAGEIGALLMESQLIKCHQPFYNVLLKFTGTAFGLGIDGGNGRPRVAAHDDTVTGCDPGTLHGLFASRSEAEQSLQSLIRQHQLCPALLGMETPIRGRACFSHQLGRCRGACIGRESRQEHDSRLLQALAYLDKAVWPFAGPIGILETEGKWRQVHVIDRWQYAGTVAGRRRRLALAMHPRIDIDTYKILAKPLAEGRLAFLNCQLEIRRNQSRFCLIPSFSALAGHHKA